MKSFRITQYKCFNSLRNLKNLKVFVLTFTLLTTLILIVGCPPSSSSQTSPATKQKVRNPDFISGSVWINENESNPFQSVKIAADDFIEIKIDQSSKLSLSYELPQTRTFPRDLNGTYSLAVSIADSTKQLLLGYPAKIQTPKVFLFTDNILNPTSAQFIVLVPSFDSNFTGETNYTAFYGFYTKGIDFMEWDILIPRRQDDNANFFELTQLQHDLAVESLVFRRTKN